MNWYILFVKTRHEAKVEKILKKLLDSELYFPFVPINEIVFMRSHHVIKKETKPLFPGYVFIETDVPSIEFIKVSKRIIQCTPSIYYYLKYDNTGEIAVREEEKSALLELCNDNYCIEESKGIIIGDKIFINEGPLIGQEGIIKRIDKHRRRAIIGLEIMGSIRICTLALEVVQKI